MCSPRRKIEIEVWTQDQYQGIVTFISKSEKRSKETVREYCPRTQKNISRAKVVDGSNPTQKSVKMRPEK